MKKFFVLSLILVGFMLPASAQSNSEVIALRIAQRLKDSLQLTAQQRDTLYGINMQLHQRKDAARAAQKDLTQLRPLLQAVEHSRDSLYRPVLGEAKYGLYLQKRGALIQP